MKLGPWLRDVQAWGLSSIWQSYIVSVQGDQRSPPTSDLLLLRSPQHR